MLLLFSLPVRHTRPPCPSPSPEVSKFMFVALEMSSHLMLWWPFLLLPWIFPSISVFYNESSASDDQNTGASTSTSVLPMSIQGQYPLRLTGLISCSPRDSQESSLAPQFKGFNLWCSAFFVIHLSQLYVTLGRPEPWLYGPLSAE